MFLIDHFPNWGLREGACQTVLQGKCRQGLSSFWICNMDESTGTEPWMPDADKRVLNQPCTGNWGFFPKVCGKVEALLHFVANK